MSKIAYQDINEVYPRAIYVIKLYRYELKRIHWIQIDTLLVFPYNNIIIVKQI